MKADFIFKKIKKGNIVKMIRNKKLRDDIPCSFEECKTCEQDSLANKLTTEKLVLFLDANLILEQIDAVQNYETIINNCIITQSEYIYLNEKNMNIFNRFKNIMDNRNIYLFPNEFHKDLIIENEDLKKKSEKRKLSFLKSVEYYYEHINAISKDYRLIVLTSDENAKIYRDYFKNDITVNSLSELAQMYEQEYPDFFNYISHYEKATGEDIEMETQAHLTESEMKSAIKQGTLFQGKIYFQPNVHNQAIIKAYLFQKDLIVNTNERINRALHGDIVCFEILDEKDWLAKQVDILMDQEGLLEEPEETDKIEEDVKMHANIKEKIESTNKTPVVQVKGILRRNRIQFCGTIVNPEDKNVSLKYSSINNYNIFIPVDPKFPNFLVRLYQPQRFYNQRILINFDKWLDTNPLPSGHLIKTIGELGNIKVENEVILYEHDINANPFSQRIINSMPREDIELKVNDEELERRTDLRHICVCSIDPPGCRDIDDALHCRTLQNGNYEIGVHIADVTHYVKAGSEVDRIAARSSNTVYLVHKRTDMLPKVLTENLCSLVGGKERYAFSVLWEVDSKSLDIIKVDYMKSVIKSRAAMTYEMANKILNDTKDNSDLAQSIRNLNKIAKKLKQDRINKGALVLASNEMKFDVNFETNTINDITMYKTFETNSLVEEFMLLANVYVADKIYKSYPSCAILRRHPLPKEKEMTQLKKLLAENGYEIDTSTSLKLSQSLDKIKKDNDVFFNKLVRIMLTRTMNQAKYFSSSEFGYEDFHHYGLAMPIYTHFTSPIRRYADVLVHRLLAAAIDIDYLPTDMSNKVRASKQCDTMNRQNRKAFFCSRDSNDLSTYQFFKELKEEMEVVIFGIDNFGVKGISTKYGIEAEIQMNIKNIDLEKKQILLASDEVLNIFDHILVQIDAGFFNYRRIIKYNFIKKIN
jgi:exosome complex exonuclease DIS3/RRP44